MDKALLDTMKELNIPQSLQETILHLPAAHKSAMWELYNHQTRINRKAKPSKDPLDMQLLMRMRELSVPQHIQSQIITLPKQKKKILLDKYNISTSLEYKEQYCFGDICDINSCRVSHISSSVAPVNNSLNIQLLDLMKQNDLALTSFGKLDAISSGKKQHYINILQKHLRLEEHDTQSDDEYLEELMKYTIASDSQYTNQICLRCLRDGSTISDDTVCIFHAFSSQGPRYDNAQYFRQRNEELYNEKNFNYACCDRECVGYFANHESQRNGCRTKKKHLYPPDITPVPSPQIEGKKRVNRRKYDLCGKWKMFVYVEHKNSLHMIRDIDIVKHSEKGQVKGYLIGTTHIKENQYQNSLDDQVFSGHITGNQLILSFCANHDYTESFVLRIEQYQLCGHFVSSHTRGTCQWFKIQQIAQ